MDKGIIGFLEGLPDGRRKAEGWTGLKQAIKVHRSVKDKGKARQENSFYVSSPEVDAQVLCKGARSRWGIENGSRWAKGVAFKKDASKTRAANAPQNISVSGNIAIDLSGTNNRQNLAQAQRPVAGDVKKSKKPIT